MVIRRATEDDVPAITDMACHQVAALYAGVWPENPAQLEALATQLVTTPNSVVFIAEREGQPIGMIAMVEYQHHISGRRTAGEVAWWLEPDARGMGVKLLKRAERWAAEQGAEDLQMMAPVPRVGRLYEHLGYRLLETTYQRAVSPSMLGPTGDEGSL